MPVLVVITEGEPFRLPFEPGPSIRDLLDTTNRRVRSACDGIGACGLCRVRILAGFIGSPTVNERIHLRDDLADGVRLACQVRPEGDVTIEIINPAQASPWKTLPEAISREHRERPHGPFRAPARGIAQPLGVAVDLGTTHISLALFDLATGRWVTDRWGRNPQGYLGADVVSRLTAAVQSQETSDRLQTLAVGAIGEALTDMGTRACIDLRRVARLSLVGNTAMLALLTGKGAPELLRPSGWGVAVDIAEPAAQENWIAHWGVASDAAIEIVPPLAGFIGSDLIAGLLAVGLAEGEQPALIIDFGTNSEIALWDGRTLWVTAAAGGSAFEASGIHYGLPAEIGAISRVKLDQASGELRYEVIGDTRPRGLCGSGLVDLTAILLRSGRISEAGRFPVDEPQRFAFTLDNISMSLSKSDVDALQRAKAAIHTGVRALCEQAGVAPSELRRLCVAGVFGRYLQVENAQAIGLLPTIPLERVELRGNTALAGCADILLLESVAAREAALRQAAHVINLAHYAHFDDFFLEGLFLRPYGA